MESSLALSIGLPAALCIIMLGMGLALRFDDFIQVIRHPRPILLGLLCMIGILPAFCFALVFWSDLPPAIGVGMMLLAASPGGTSAAIFTHLARGDVALSITLAAVSTLLALVTIPAIANVSLWAFYGEVGEVRLQTQQVLQIFLIAIVPALIGAYIRSRHPEIALRLDRPVKRLATLFLAAVVIFALVSQWGLIGRWGPTVGAVVLAFNLVSLAIGYWLPRAFGIERRQSIAIAMSIGIHNAALVIAVAMSEYMLNDPEMAVPPAAYGLIAYLTGGMVVWVLNRTARDVRPAPG